MKAVPRDAPVSEFLTILQYSMEHFGNLDAKYSSKSSSSVSKLKFLIKIVEDEEPPSSASASDSWSLFM